MNRGIISAQAEIHRIPNGIKTGRSLSLDELRYYTLYWDKVVIPSSSLFYFELPQEESFISSGVLERPRVSISGNIDSELMLSIQSKVAESLMKDQSTDWVIQQLGLEVALPKEFSIRRNILRVDLAQCLPVPTGNVSVQDILEFKLRRRDEFLALHEHLDELYEQALLSPDKSLSSKKAVSNLSKSIESIGKVTQEEFKISKKFDLSAELKISGGQLLTGAVAGAIIDSKINFLEIPIATIAGAVLSTLSLSAKPSITFEPAQNNLKLAYLTSAQKEGLY